MNLQFKFHLKSFIVPHFQICIANMVRIIKLSPTYLCTMTAPSVFGSLYAKAI